MYRKKREIGVSYAASKKALQDRSTRLEGQLQETEQRELLEDKKYAHLSLFTPR